MQNVKSTMIDNLLDLIAPHYCSSCGEIGSLLCVSCKNDIVESDNLACLLCGQLAGAKGVCGGCRPVIELAWYGGERSGSLEVLIDTYKFRHARAAFRPLGDLLLARLPVLPHDTVIVPIPSAPAHIRQRGFDHTLLLARYLTKQRGLRLARPLVRRASSAQRGADRQQRLKQARVAFAVHGPVQPNVPYLLIDDVVTTGATLLYASKAIKRAGADTVWAAAIARQPLQNNR